jgi:Ca2+-dependent lipid-binding protein
MPTPRYQKSAGTVAFVSVFCRLAGFVCFSFYIVFFSIYIFCFFFYKKKQNIYIEKTQYKLNKNGKKHAKVQS